MPSRRECLQAVGAGAPAVAEWSWPTREPGSKTSGTSSARSAPATVEVHVHRVPSVDDDVFERVVRAVAVGVEQVVRHADRTLDRAVDRDVVAGGTTSPRTVSTASRQAVFESSADWLERTDRRASDAVHLVLVDAPFENAVGYGGNRTHLLDGGPVSYANVGATEQWDDADVTDNIAVHEVLHALVTPRESRSVVGRGCEHDLGAVHAVGGDGAIATPMATAYAETTWGGETQWAGSGCSNAFSADVRYDPAWWGHTSALSAATRTATARYLERL